MAVNRFDDRGDAATSNRARRLVRPPLNARPSNEGTGHQWRHLLMTTTEDMLHSEAAPGRQGSHLLIPGSRRVGRRNNLVGYLFIGPWLIGFLAFTLVPMLASLYFAFTDYSLLSAPRWVGLANFQTMFTQDLRY